MSPGGYSFNLNFLLTASATSLPPRGIYAQGHRRLDQDGQSARSRAHMGVAGRRVLRDNRGRDATGAVHEHHTYGARLVMRFATVRARLACSRTEDRDASGFTWSSWPSR